MKYVTIRTNVAKYIPSDFCDLIQYLNNYLHHLCNLLVYQHKKYMLKKNNNTGIKSKNAFKINLKKNINILSIINMMI